MTTGAERTLYELLPALYRRRDAEEGMPLRALLEVLEEQRVLVRESVRQQYADWFVETCQDWVLPYIGALVGHEALPGYGAALARGGAADRAAAAAAAPRRDIARTLANRRRKGTLAVLEDLARDVADWPARAVEFRTLLAFDQPVRRYPADGRGIEERLRSGRLADLRCGGELDLVDGPFDRLAHSADVRRTGSAHGPGHEGVAGVGLFVWRLGAHSLTRAPAYCVDRDRGHFTFSVLGNDTPLVTLPVAEPAPTHVADETNVPAFIRRRAFEERTAHYYGPGKSLCLWNEDGTPVPLSAIVAADLSHWEPPHGGRAPRRGEVAVDPVLGRIAFAPRSAPEAGLRVSYHHAFPAPMGGGEYPVPVAPSGPGAARYRVGPGEEFERPAQAVARWYEDKRADPARREAVIELVGSVAFRQRTEVRLDRGDRLTVRAAPGSRPVLRLLDWHADRPDALRFTGTGRGEGPLPSLRLAGLMVAGRGVRVRGPVGRVEISHCTLVPGWSLDRGCRCEHPGAPSLELVRTPACVEVRDSITGTVLVEADAECAAPNRIFFADSVLDATSAVLPAFGGADGGCAYAELSARATTVIGTVRTHAVGVVEDSLLVGAAHVAVRDRGCVRFCYLAPGSRTPAPFHCEPAASGDPARVVPRFTSTAYGTPGYAQLSAACPPEIRRGAGDGSEPGAFHGLFQPRREDGLRGRLAEYAPAGTSCGVLFVT
ncbi:hypothetical protein [Streptomyces sp. SPB4]|uniref:hypothetical protein n=1 Tax=Streptomyces sp. SPB4 TaxID=2940553 RepID=UPI002476F47F|nr:hypothetical protein [Streptomyces sp. SPB4]MDH6540195.1 hypothetical protein [Streptomyces sp. SPB4]